VTALTALTISAFASPFDCCPDYRLRYLGVLSMAVLWFVAVSVVHSIVLVAMCVDVKVGHLSGPS
jgi:hypothetical protein